MLSRTFDAWNNELLGSTKSKSIGKNLGSNYSQNLIDHAKQSAAVAFETTSKRAIQKTEKANGDLIGNKVADKIIRVSKTSAKNNSETKEEEILTERYISTELRHKTINYLRLKQ